MDFYNLHTSTFHVELSTKVARDSRCGSVVGKRHRLLAGRCLRTLYKAVLPWIYKICLKKKISLTSIYRTIYGFPFSSLFTSHLRYPPLLLPPRRLPRRSPGHPRRYRERASLGCALFLWSAKQSPLPTRPRIFCASSAFLLALLPVACRRRRTNLLPVQSDDCKRKK